MIIYSGWVVWGEADVGRMMRSIEAYEHKDNGYEVLDMMVFFFFFFFGYRGLDSSVCRVLSMLTMADTRS